MRIAPAASLRNTRRSQVNITDTTPATAPRAGGASRRRPSTAPCAGDRPLGCVRDQIVVSLREQPQHGRVILEPHGPQLRMPQRNHRRRAGIARVGLGDPRRVQQPRTRRQRRRHIQHGLTDCDELLRHRPLRRGTGCRRLLPTCARLELPLSRGSSAITPMGANHYRGSSRGIAPALRAPHCHDLKAISGFVVGDRWPGGGIRASLGVLRA
jgi:hypothetical protein